MKDTGSQTSASSVKRQAAKDIVYRTTALAIFAAIAVGLLRSTIFFIPCVSAVAFLYVASIVKIVLAGRISGPLYTSMRAFAVTLLFTTFFMAPDLPSAAGSVAPAIFLLGTIWAAHFTTKAYAEIAGVATRSLLIAAVGYLYYSLFAAADLPAISLLSLVVLTGFVGTAVFAFVGIVSGHSDARIAAAGKLFTGLWSPVAAGTAAAVIVAYLVFLRPSLIALGSFWITLAEWAAVGAVIIALFLKIRSFMPRGDLPSFGDGHTVAGRICFEKGEIEKVSATIEEFVATGKKDGLATLTMATLLKNDIPLETVQKVISVIVDYREEREPPVLFRWAVGDLDAARRKKRMEAVDKMIAAAADAVNAGSTGA
jgi:hypothetical protein